MSESVKAERLRELNRIARHLRDSAAATRDPDAVDMFLRAAFAVEERISQVATHAGLPEGTDDIHVRPHADIRV
jgi:hypothetical protein